MGDRAGIAIEAVGASLANKVTATGGVTGAVGWLVDINWIGLVGLAVAVLGFLVNAYFSYRKDRRETAESEARLAQLRSTLNGQ